MWLWGPVDKEKKRLVLLLGSIAHLKRRGLCCFGVIGAYHARRVALLMACAIPLFGMGLGMHPEGMTFAQGSLRDSEITQCIREALDGPEAVFAVEGHPVMRLDTGFIDLVSAFPPSFHVLLLSGSYFGFIGRCLQGQFSPLHDSHAPLPEDEAVCAANRAADEARKKDAKKEEEKKTQTARQHGKCQQRSNEEVEEDDDDDDGDDEEEEYDIPRDELTREMTTRDRPLGVSTSSLRPCAHPGAGGGG
ncbi:uncharacterized protein LOC112902446 [Panicum hallii]|jgi:hypothetical protein|uniref:uncharacterized protein LOC112902446 n=1 Tax=Panicum hallii TaxID=206008 RepID=UPI000DF4DFD4|nr:uncharacterized protein LOC112902446 [Panicum hallii]XP_025827311.1 uncharacterized protein LOC112902446 [Panicum hallii]XP_025827312.1 uncharacterized protein LOC112902446 [Panicum hallii]